MKIEAPEITALKGPFETTAVRFRRVPTENPGDLFQDPNVLFEKNFPEVRNMNLQLGSPVPLPLHESDTLLLYPRPVKIECDVKPITDKDIAILPLSAR